MFAVVFFAFRDAYVIAWFCTLRVAGVVAGIRASCSLTIVGAGAFVVVADAGVKVAARTSKVGDGARTATAVATVAEIGRVTALRAVGTHNTFFRFFAWAAVGALVTVYAFTAAVVISAFVLILAII